MKRKHIIILVVAILLAVVVWVAAFISLSKPVAPESLTNGKTEDKNIVSPEEFGAVDIEIKDIPVTPGTGLIDKILDINFKDHLGGLKND